MYLIWLLYKIPLFNEIERWHCVLMWVIKTNRDLFDSKKGVRKLSTVTATKF